MSKAFTREDDDQPDRLAALPRPVLPPGAKNYLTRDGATRFEAELRNLAEVERPVLAALAPAEPEAAMKLARLDRRIRQLQEILQSAVVVDPPAEQDQVRFGATIEVRDAAGELDRYRIVGVDEIDLDRGWISFLSPLARALMNKKVGEKVRFGPGTAPRVLEILRVEFEH